MFLQRCAELKPEVIILVFESLEFSVDSSFFHLSIRLQSSELLENVVEYVSLAVSLDDRKLKVF